MSTLELLWPIVASTECASIVVRLTLLQVMTLWRYVIANYTVDGVAVVAKRVVVVDVVIKATHRSNDERA